MNEQDRDFTVLAILIAALAGISILHTRVLRANVETLVRHDEDITFLRLVARRLEDKVAE